MQPDFLSRAFRGARIAVLSMVTVFTASGAYAGFGDPAPPKFSIAFSPNSIDAGQVTRLTYTIKNTNLFSSAVVLDFTNNLPTGLVVSTSPNVSNTCSGGTVTAAVGSSVISYTGGSVSSNSTCTIAVTLTSDVAGYYTNVTGNLTSSMGNSGTASASLTVIQTDTVAPVLELSGLPETFLPGDVFSLTFTFSEDVTGFDNSDVVVTGGVLSGFAGGPSVYTATLTPDGDADVTVSVAADAAVDGADNGSNAISETASLDSASVAGEVVTDFMQTRARNLIGNQPGLARFLTGGQGAGASMLVTSTMGTMDLHSGTGPLWFSLSGAKADLADGGESAYALATLGGHFELNPGLLIGAMLQVDYAEEDLGDGIEASGTGWLAGPYVVAQLGDQPLYLEGRLLYGESSNEISPLGTYTDDFDSERWLAMVALEGAYEAEALRFFPRLQLTHAVDRQRAYVDGLSNDVPAQTLRLSEVSAGINFEAPLFGDTSGHLLTWGMSGIWSQVDGDAVAAAYISEDEVMRGRIDLGYRFSNGSGLSVTSDLFLDGIGLSDYTAYGLEIGLSFVF